MSKRVLLMIGTEKGGFIAESDERRQDWKLHGPFCNQDKVNDMQYDPATGAIYAAGFRWTEAWDHLPVIYKTTDLGQTWSYSDKGLTLGDDGPKMIAAWNLQPAHGAMYAGTEPAALFRSNDGGESWQHVKGLREHPTTPKWQPGNGGLCLHSIVPHPDDPGKMTIGISAAGAFMTEDGGETWQPCNKGVRDPFSPEPQEWGFCVHKMVRAPGQPDLMYQQNHFGVYRSKDGGRTWDEITEGLPSEFGFPMVIHPRDAQTVWVIPAQDHGRFMPGGSAAVYRSRTGGDSWERLSQGLPQEHAYFGILREGMAIDTLDRAGVYFGTTTGLLYASADEGENWQLISGFLPRINSVNAVVLDG